jgi:hypothetical protein
MIKPDFNDADDVLEYAARLIEDSSLLDLCGVMAKRKRDREDADLRFRTIQETRAEMARHIRAMKSRPDLDARNVLAKLAALPSDGRNHDMHLRDAWPLAWKGWCNIKCTVICNSNCCPPETEYRIEITDYGREILAAVNIHQRGEPDG